MGNADTGSATRNNRSICVPISQEIYSANIADAGNFAPWCPETVKHHGHKSPAERLNRFCYSESWIENLLISGSLGGYRTPPQNPL